MNTSQAEAKKLYFRENNAGNGYAPDAESVDDAIDAAVEEDWIVVLRPKNTSDVAVLRNDVDDMLMLIGGDGSGGSAWAVDVDPGAAGQ